MDRNNDVNNSINCSVANCNYNDNANCKCTLNSIDVSCCDAPSASNAASKADTVCSSFEGK